MAPAESQSQPELAGAKHYQLDGPFQFKKHAMNEFGMTYCKYLNFHKIENIKNDPGRFWEHEYNVRTSCFRGWMIANAFKIIEKLYLKPLMDTLVSMYI